MAVRELICRRMRRPAPTVRRLAGSGACEAGSKNWRASPPCAQLSVSFSRRVEVFPNAGAAPDIIEAIFSGRAGQSLMLEQLERPLPASWKDQRLMMSSSP